MRIPRGPRHSLDKTVNRRHDPAAVDQHEKPTVEYSFSAVQALLDRIDMAGVLPLLLVDDDGVETWTLVRYGEAREALLDYRHAEVGPALTGPREGQVPIPIGRPRRTRIVRCVE